MPALSSPFTCTPVRPGPHPHSGPIIYPHPLPAAWSEACEILRGLAQAANKRSARDRYVTAIWAETYLNKRLHFNSRIGFIEGLEDFFQR